MLQTTKACILFMAWWEGDLEVFLLVGSHPAKPKEGRRFCRKRFLCGGNLRTVPIEVA